MKFSIILLTGILAATVQALAPRELAPHNFEIRPSYTGPLSGGYDHKLLADGRVQFTINVTNLNGTVVTQAKKTCPSWYHKCLNAEPDYAAADGGSVSAGDAWCENQCETVCTVCNLKRDPESEFAVARSWDEIDEGMGLEKRSECSKICDLISAGGRAATLNMRSLAVAAGEAIAKAACYATCAYLEG